MARAKKSTKKSTKKVEEKKVEGQVEATEASPEAAAVVGEATESAPETKAEETKKEAPEEAVGEAIAETMGETRTVAKILGNKKAIPSDILASLARHKNEHISKLGKALQEYTENMSGFPAIHPTKAASSQQNLYLAMKEVMEKEDHAEFKDGMKILLWWFSTFSDGVASPNRVNAFMGQWHMGQRTKYSFATLNSFMILAANKGIENITKMVNVDSLVAPDRSDLTERAGNNLRRLLGVE